METKQNKSSRKTTLYIIVAVLVVASIAFRILNWREFEQTSLVFIGIPALITILLVRYGGQPKSAYGVAFKVITIFLLMSAILFGEGVVCIIFAAPIFYGIAALLVFISEYARKKNDKLKSIILIPVSIILMQPIAFFSETELQEISSSKIVSGHISFDALTNEPDFMADLPSFFKIGFPKPLAINGGGLKIGDVREIQFESSTKGIGTLSLKVDSINENEVQFSFVEDKSHINHWLTWERATVKLNHLKDNQTEITWITEFTCDLGPQWYFVPLERFAVDQMNVHLLNSYFD